MIIESKKRSLLKTLSWRVTATVTTITLVYLFTGQVATALAVGGIEVFAKMAIYYFHERGWEKIKFGRREVRPSVVWLTGLTGSGKGEIARSLVEELRKRNYKVELLNGQEIRGMIPDIGFEREDRISHIKRVAYFAKKLEANGTFVVASFISPDREAREFVRNSCRSFIEVHCSTPLELCEERESTGLYQKARTGQVKNVCGIHFDYEPSPQVELNIDLTKQTPEQAVAMSLEKVLQKA